MKKLILLLLFIPLVSFGQKEKISSHSKTIDSLTIDMIANKGLISTYQNIKNQLYFEISDTLLKKNLLVVTRFAQLPANYSGYLNAGSKTAEHVVEFVKQGNKILLQEVSYSNVADKYDPISISVSENNFKPILASFEIKNSEKNRHLIDVTDYFMSDSPGFNIIRSYEKDNYKIGSVDKKRSFIDSARSFPNNTEILHTLTFSANKAPRENRTKTFSFQINHSIISLPKNPMPIRYEDERVGWFTLGKINYSSEKLKSDNYNIIRRWRLEPSDLEAYNKGQLVDPIKPIVYYLDPGTPMKWRKYFKMGIEDWNTSFEKAGFKNAIIAKDPPSKEEDPNFSPEDIRYSTVRYVASTTRNATGPSVSDPRTGEILESDIIWYHNHLRSYRNRYLLETGAANPKGRTLNTPEEEIGEMMRRVISHEVGHALGLPHNMKASSAYPVDSLRSGSFTQKFGIATTIMDYARYNYVAQPGDENIRFVRQIGPYDDYSIEWGYRYYGKSPEQEKEILKKVVDSKSLDPVYMFGGNGNDPNSQTENIGDDPAKASMYGIKNLKIVANNLMKWTVEPNENYSELNELYGELIGVYRRYIYHVLSLVGGVYDTPHNENQKGVTRFVNVDSKKQTEALSFLEKNLWNTQNWLMKSKMISQIKGEGVLNSIQGLQIGALNRLLNTDKLNRMLSSKQTLKGDALSVNELIENLFETLIKKPSNPDVSEQRLQLYFVERIDMLMEEKDINPTIKSFLLQIKNDIYSFAKKKSRSSNVLSKSHYKYLKSITE
ncbi:zinc-dependent metalloprotease [Flavobacteriaceae bacterium]|nr:zinc-dependent metalloprotease [Flavobacteriaceae bacterium]MDB4060125.1 zinc-dependent metalloprotease [Flavobacteriaceae bacterium]MDB9827773.1 zinc-dependent metalloprotease [Flavobacteriaceae bacterium]